MKQQVKPPVSKLMSELASPERAVLIKKLGISRATWFRWQEQPGMVPVPQADIIRLFLQAAYGEKYDLITLFCLPKGRKERQAA